MFILVDYTLDVTWVVWAGLWQRWHIGGDVIVGALVAAGPPRYVGPDIVEFELR